MSVRERKLSWITFNTLEWTYDTIDGTKVAAEVSDECGCLIDVIRITNIRESQRISIKEGKCGTLQPNQSLKE